MQLKLHYLCRIRIASTQRGVNTTDGNPEFAKIGLVETSIPVD